MRILLIGVGGVGEAFAKIAARRSFYDHIALADYSVERAESCLTSIAEREGQEGAARFSTHQLDASDPEAITALAITVEATHIMNAVEPSFVDAIFAAAGEAHCTYIDMAMSLSKPHESAPHSSPGVMLGDRQFAEHDHWKDADRLALVGMGVEPGLSDVFARYAADELFSSIEELGVRDGANLVVRDEEGRELFAPSFSIWTTIEECLNPPLLWERGRGWFTTEPFSEPEVFEFPEGIGPVECVNVEHEEVVLMPRWIEAERVTFKYGLGSEFIGVLKTLNLLGLDSTNPVQVRSANGPVPVAPRDVVAAVLPNPATIGPRMTGNTCAGVNVTGVGVDGAPRETYLYHVSDNEWTMAEYGVQCVVWQTALAPVIALELLAAGTWSGAGVLGPEAFDARPFLELMSKPIEEGGYGQPWGLRDATDVGGAE
ncbi:saccharopine dehydrogenase family protein [Humidisolicoccus flavus]|uniref:saccharopine dehydrogenase family protein n=1 Tax=Humidisolicoccus flavus TaxID=3111414 RepID=UPI0032567C0B